MKTITVPVVELRQNGTRLLLTSLKAGHLEHFTKVDPFDASKAFDDKSQGYQRPPEEARIRKLGNWLKREFENGGKVTMPTAILLSGREADMRVNPADRTITLNAATKLAVIDGQHRKCGFKYAIEEKGVKELAEFEIPVVILPEVDKITEMTQFRIVNGEAKSVRTDLVNMILTQLAGLQGEDSISEKDAWRVVVSKVVKKLNEDQTGPWFDKIVMPDGRSYDKNEVDADPALKHRRVARATSFYSALKPLETWLFMHQAKRGSIDDRVEKLFGVVDSFWRAVRSLNPECFKDSDNYVMQKTPGIFALNEVCHSLLPKMSDGKRDFTAPEFEVMLRDSAEITRADYWFVGEDGTRGEAAKYGSMKGFSELADLLIGGLER